MKIFVFLFLLPVLAVVSYSQSDSAKTVNTDEIIITANRTPSTYIETTRIVYTLHEREFINLPSLSVSDLLSVLPATDIRRRGAMGVQTDVSIRGGTFDQTLILINGIKMSDPQTGHHNMNLPVSKDDIERIEILEGPGSRVLGPNAYSGAINIITKKPSANTANVALSGGQKGFYNLFASGSFSSDTAGTFSNYLSLGKSGSSGYTTNTDFQIGNILYTADLKTKIGDFQALAGYNDRHFGANSFYSPVYPNEFERTKSLLAYLKYNKTVNNFIFNVNAFWRRHQDKFELFRSEPAPWYKGHNYHLTNVLGAEFNQTLVSQFGLTSLGLGYQSDNIRSNVLGVATGDTIPVPGESGAFFTKHALREITNVFLEHVYYKNQFSVSGGVLANYTSNYKWHFYGGLDLGYRFGEFYQLVASVNQSLRMPTFTDLYYHDPSNIGNPNLTPEKALAIELGLKINTDEFKSYVSVYKRFGSQTIDWVRQKDTSIWRSMNITELNATGIDAGITYFFTQVNIPLKFISLNYSHAGLSKSSGDFLSNYSLDFLKNKVSLNIEHELWTGIGMNWKFSYIDRAGSYYNYADKSIRDYKPYLLIDAKLFYAFSSFIINLEAANLTNTRYIEHNNIPTPGRWLILGFNYFIR